MITLVLLAATVPVGELCVFVTDDEGGPRAGQAVVILGETFATDVAGVVCRTVPTGDTRVYVGGQVNTVQVEEHTVTDVFFHTARDPAVFVDEPAIDESVEVARVERKITQPGVVRDERGGPIAGARVIASGGQESVTDEDGAFSLEVPAGSELIFVATRFQSVTQKAEGAALEITLTPAGVELEAFTARAPHVAGTSAAASAERFRSTSIVDVLGAEQIKRGGDSDAAGALKRVTGLSVVGGRYVFVRGLGDRYSSTLMDGAMLPSPEPERRVVPLDLFPTSGLESVLVQKAYAPHLYGDFGGGAVLLRPKGLPEERQLKVSLKFGAHDTLFQPRIASSSGALAFTGADFGARALPKEIRAASTDQSLKETDRFSDRGYTPEDLEAFGETLVERTTQSFDTNLALILPKLGLDVTWAERKTIDAGEVGFTLALTYDHSDRARAWEQQYFLLGQGSALERSHTYAFDERVRSVNIGGLFAAAAELGDLDLRATTFLGRNTDDEARLYEGLNRDVGSPIRVSRQRWLERTIVSEQLAADYKLNDVELRARYTASIALRSEPDRREMRLDRQESGELWLLSDRPEGNQRVFSELFEHAHDLRVSAKMPAYGLNVFLENSTIDVGGALALRDRAVDTRRYKFQHKGPPIKRSRRARARARRDLRQAHHRCRWLSARGDHAADRQLHRGRVRPRGILKPRGAAAARFPSVFRGAP